MSRLLLPAGLLLAFAVTAAPSPAATLITPGFNSTVVFKAVAPSGGPVVFSTRARLSSLDRDSAWDLYVRSKDEPARLVSTGNGASANPSYPTVNRISDDGSRIVFSTRARLTGGDDDSATDIYERAGGHTRLLTGGRQGSGAYFKGASLDATRVIFTSKEALTADDTDARYDVFRAEGGSITRLSQGPAGGNGPFDAGLSEIAGRFVAGEPDEVSPDGLTVAFRTAEKLTADDPDDQREVYLSEAGGVSRLSPGTTAAPRRGVQILLGPISKDWSHIFFHTPDALVPEDTNGAPDLYERTAAGPRRVVEAPLASFSQAWVSLDGTRIIVATDFAVTPKDTDTRGDVYERAGDGTIRLLSPLPPGAYSHDYGVRIAFNLARVRGIGLNDDRSRVFVETQDQLSPADTDRRLDVYMLRSGAAPKLLSLGPLGGNRDCSPYSGCNAYFAGASASGGRVIFQTRERLTADDTDNRSDLYLSEDGVLRKVSAGNGDFDAVYRAISDDGLEVLYTTAERLSASDRDRGTDIYAESL